MYISKPIPYYHCCAIRLEVLIILFVLKPPNSMAAGDSVAAKATKIAKALRLKRNQDTTKYFAGAMAAIMVLFIISHFTRYLFKRCNLSKKESAPIRLTLAVTRYVQHCHFNVWIAKLTDELQNNPKISSAINPYFPNKRTRIDLCWAFCNMPSSWIH